MKFSMKGNGHCVYFIAAIDMADPPEIEAIRIGFTRDLESRVVYLWDQVPWWIDVLSLYEIRFCNCPIDEYSVVKKNGDRFKACRLERAIQRRLDRFRISGEWFELPPGEWMAHPVKVWSRAEAVSELNLKR